MRYKGDLGKIVYDNFYYGNGQADCFLKTQEELS